MGIFKGSRDRRKGIAFTLPDTGIEGRAFGLSPAMIMEIANKLGSTDELVNLAKGEIATVMATAPGAVARVIAMATGEDPEDAETIQGILDLPAPDLKVLTEACVEATTRGEDPKDFFGGWARNLGLDGLFQAVPSGQLSQGQTSSEGIILQSQEIPQEVAADLESMV